MLRFSESYGPNHRLENVKIPLWLGKQKANRYSYQDIHRVASFVHAFAFYDVCVDQTHVIEPCFAIKVRSTINIFAFQMVIPLHCPDAIIINIFVVYKAEGPFVWKAAHSNLNVFAKCPILFLFDVWHKKLLQSANLL